MLPALCSEEEMYCFVRSDPEPVEGTIVEF